MASKCCDTCRHFLMTGTGPHGICDAPAPSWTLAFTAAVTYEIAREMQATYGKECPVYSAWSEESKP